jgi:putative flippase GtrA
MRAAARAFMSRPSGRYLVIGGSVYLFELVVIFVAQQMGASTIVAVGLSFWLGLAVSFALQKFVTFGDKRTHHRVLLPQIIAVSLLALFNFGFTLAVAKTLAAFLPAVVIRTLALSVTVVWNFYLYKTHIFKPAEGTIY